MLALVFRITIFGDFSNLKPTATNTIEYAKALSDAGYQYLPSIISPTAHINISNGLPPQIVPGNPEDKRLQFVSVDNRSLIRLLSNRIDVEFNEDEFVEVNSYFEEKLMAAIKTMQVVLSAVGNPDGNRLAYYVDIVVPEPEERSFINFYKNNNLGIIMTEIHDECIEWRHGFNNRVGIEVEDKLEICNALFSFEAGKLQKVDNASGEQNIIQGFHFSGDINTLAENTIMRFSSQSFYSFAPNAQRIFVSVLHQISEGLFS